MPRCDVHDFGNHGAMARASLKWAARLWRWNAHRCDGDHRIRSRLAQFEFHRVVLPRLGKEASGELGVAAGTVFVRDASHLFTASRASKRDFIVVCKTVGF